MDFTVFDQDLRNSGPRIVVGGHDKAIGAWAHDSQQISRLDVRKRAVFWEEVTRFAHGPHDFDHVLGAVQLRFGERTDVVISIV